jgi:hypothetical protein
MEKPQSIVHQVIRLERKVTRMVKRTASLGSKKKNNFVSRRSSLNTCASIDEPTCHESSPEESPVFDKAIKELAVAAPVPVISVPAPVISVPVTQYGDYRTINQNEFFIECMINGEGASSVIHFFDKDSTHSMEMDALLEIMAKKFTTCKFLRIDSAWTQFVAAKLGIKKFPTVLAIQNKVILDRLTFEEMDYFSEEFLHGWLVRTIPL